MKKVFLMLSIFIISLSSPAFADFANPGFEDGPITFGWTNGSGNRNSSTNPINLGTVNNTDITPAMFLPGGSYYNSSYLHSGLVSPGTDPNVPTSMVYAGNYSARIEDRATGGYASAISQTVTNWQGGNIFFAWKAVMLGAHGPDDSATMVITLDDLSDALPPLVSRQYNAASGSGGVDPRFTLAANGWYYTADWQIEQISTIIGHDYILSVLASDCSPTAHPGYVYLDGFGDKPPDPGDPVPEPATLMLLGAGLIGLAGYSRKRM